MVRSQKSGVRSQNWLSCFLLVALPYSLFPVPCLGQQPQTSVAPIYAVNAKYVQGLGPGYWPTAGAGLTLNLAPGTAYCGKPPTLVNYAGGSLALTDAATNYVYLDPAAACAPAKNTTGFAVGVIPLATVVTAGGAITSVTDARGWFAPLPCDVDSAGAVTCAALGTNQNVTLAPSGTGVTQIGDNLLTLHHAITDWDVKDLEITTNYDPVANRLKDPSQHAWDFCIACNAGGEPAAGEADLYYAAPTSEAPIWTKKWSLDHLGIMRDVTLILTPRLNSIRFADQFPTIQAAIDDLPDAGGTVFIPAGTYVTGTITFPASPKVVRLLGAGTGATILQASAPNQKIIAATYTDGIYAGNFTVQAHASGSTGPAIDLSGFRASVFDNIGYRANGSGNFASFFRLSACRSGGNPGPPPTCSDLAGCYGNLIRHPLVMGQALGGMTIIQFDNGGTNSATYQANANRIENAYFGENTGVAALIDARRSSLTVISGGLMEQNGYQEAGAKGIIPGTMTTIEGVWIELNGETPSTSTLVPQTGEDGSSTDVVVKNNFFGNQVAVNLAGYSNWRADTNAPAGWLTFTGGTNNVVVEAATFQNTMTFNDGLRVPDQKKITFSLPGGNATYIGDIGGLGYWEIQGGPSGGRILNTPYTTELMTWTNAGLFTFPYSLKAKQLYTDVNVVPFSSTPTFDASLGNTQKITLTGNVTSSTLSNAVAGQAINFLVCQDATGGRTFVWPTNIKGGMTIGSTASKCNAQTFIFDGTNAYALSPGVTNM
jgi:hypothetical protein